MLHKINPKVTTQISVLWDGPRLLQDKAAIRSHVDEFYKNLFCAQPRAGISLQEGIWPAAMRVSDEENIDLLAPFSEAELEAAINSMKPDSARVRMAYRCGSS